MIKNKLREIRMREFMMNPGEFADKLGISIKILWSYEHDKSRPTLEGALEIAKILNKKVEDIWYLE